jgi:hypothetical protein
MEERRKKPRDRSAVFISLAEAAGIAYGAATGKTADDQTLDTIARAMASHVRLFAHQQDPPDYVLVFPLELDEGVIEEGAKALRFRDGRRPLESLCIFRSDLPKFVIHFELHYKKGGGRR